MAGATPGIEQLALRSQMPDLVLQAAASSCTLQNENAGKEVWQGWEVFRLRFQDGYSVGMTVSWQS